MLASVLCFALTAAPASWSDVAAKFPPLTLPVQLSDTEKPAKPLDASELAALGFQSRKEPVFQALRRSLRADGVQVALSPVGQFSLGSVQLLVVRVDTRLVNGAICTRYLLSYGADGALISGFRFESSADGEIGADASAATISPAGAITQSLEHSQPLHEVPVEKWLAVRAEAQAQVRPDGSFEAGPMTFQSREGEFQDAQSKDRIFVVGKTVWYRSSSGKGFEQLERAGDSVRSATGAKACVLAWTQRRDALSCRDAAGAEQTFKRTWHSF